MSQQAVRQATRRSALDAQAVLRRERANRERRLERLAVAVLIALGEREGRGSERGTPRRCGAADDDRRRGLSLREARRSAGAGIIRIG
jgi:hypothetical protein